MRQTDDSYKHFWKFFQFPFEKLNSIRREEKLSFEEKVKEKDTRMIWFAENCKHATICWRRDINFERGRV